LLYNAQGKLVAYKVYRAPHSAADRGQ
jgi:hypothetical protein